MTVYGTDLVIEFSHLAGVPYVLGGKWNYPPPKLYQRPRSLDCSGGTKLVCTRHGVPMTDGSWAQEDFCRSHGTYVGGLRGIQLAKENPGWLLFRRANTNGDPIGHVALSRSYNATWECANPRIDCTSLSINGRVWTGAAAIPGVIYGAAPPPQPGPPQPVDWVALRKGLAMHYATLYGAIPTPLSPNTPLTKNTALQISLVQQILALILPDQHLQVSGRYDPETTTAMWVFQQFINGLPGQHVHDFPGVFGNETKLWFGASLHRIALNG